MGTGYTRNDTANNIADGNVINAADFDGEFDAIVTAFSTSGHTHDGTSAEGGAITKIGPAQDITVSASVVTPKTNNTLDLGSLSSQFKDIYIDGSAYIDGLAEDILVATDKKVLFRDSAIYIHSSTDGQLDIVADTEVQIAATTIDINGNVDISGSLSVGSFSITEIDSASNLTLDAESDIILDANDADVLFKDNGTQYGALTNNSGNLIIKSGSTTALTFSGANVTAAGTITGSLSGNASTATALETARTIAGQSFDGTANITIASTDLSNTSNITLNNASQTLTNKTLTTPIIEEIDGSSITLDSSGDITLDAGGADILLKDDGTTFGGLTNSSGQLVIKSGSTPTSSLTFNDANITAEGNLTVGGNLIVSGTTTTVNSTIVNLNDHNIILDSGNSTSAVINGAGITIEGGSGDDATFTYNTSGPKFELKLGSSHEDLQVDGLIAASLDISGNADIDGTLEADVITVNGTALDEFISDTVGAMVSSNTETGISVTYADGDNTLDFALSTAQTSIESIKNTSLVIGRDNDNLIKFSTDNQIIFEVDGGDNVIFKSSGEIEASSLDISGDVDIDGTLETDALSINGTTVNSTAAELNIMDGGTSASSTTLVAADRVVTNDDGTMKQVAISDFQTYFQNNLTLNGSSGVTTVGALNSGSITTGFGNIDNGSSNITTGGLLKLDVDADADDLTGDSATGRLTLGAGEDLNLYHGGTNSYIVNDTGDLYIDTAGDLYFDSAGNETRFLFGGTQVGLVRNSSSDFVIQSSVSNKDIIFNGNMGGSVSTAFTLDMSNNGRAIFNEDLDLQSDSSVLRFGEHGEIRFKHNHNTGLDFIHQTADTSGPNLNFISKNTTVTDTNVLGSITFQADSEASGSDAILQSAGIFVLAEGAFTSTANPTRFVFSTSASEAASGSDSSATVIQSDGDVSIGNNLTVGGDLSVLTSGLTTATTANIGTSASVGADLTVGDDIILDSDSSSIQFGDDQDVLLSHIHNQGLSLIAPGSSAHTPILTLSTSSTSDDTFPILRLQSSENNVSANEPIGSIQFKATDASGTDAELVSAGIHAIGETNFTATANPTKLVFTTGVSESADHDATAKMTLSSAGLLTIADDFIIKDGGTIGVTSANDAMTVSSAGIVTFKDDIVIKDGGTIGVSSANDAMTISSAGIVTFKDDIIIKDSGTIGSATAPGTITIGSTGKVTLTKATNGTALELNCADTGTLQGPNILLNRDVTGANGDAIGGIDFGGQDDGSGNTLYAEVKAEIENASSSSETTEFYIKTFNAGSSAKRMSIKGGRTVFNIENEDVDFVVAGSSNVECIHVDSGNNGVGFFTDGRSDSKVAIDASGATALRTLTNGDNNLILGLNAGDAIASGGNDNVFLGDDAGTAVTTGDENTAVGYQAGASNQTSSGNTYIGKGAGNSATSQQNTFVGESSGSSVTSGEKNTVLGRFNGNENGLDMRTLDNNIVLSDGDGNLRFRVTSTGAISFGAANGSTSISAGAVGLALNSNEGLQLLDSRTNSDSNTFRNRYYNTNGQVGGIRTSGSTTFYDTSSDYRLKENVVPVNDGIEIVKQLQPKRFNYIADPDTTMEGFIAHELQEVVPLAANGEKDATDENGILPQSIDVSKIVPHLTAALKEAITKIETLETKVAALEAE